MIDGRGYEWLRPLKILESFTLCMEEDEERLHSFVISGRIRAKLAGTEEVIPPVLLEPMLRMYGDLIDDDELSKWTLPPDLSLSVRDAQRAYSPRRFSDSRAVVRHRGRPKGSSPYAQTDRVALREIDRLVREGHTIHAAAQTVAVSLPGQSQEASVRRLMAKFAAEQTTN